jgi:hypothetical protein
MDRVGVTRPEDKIIGRAATVAHNRIGGLGTATRSAPPAREVTQEGTDDDGNIYTIHVMLWDVDSWDDPGSVWADGAAGLKA